MTAKTKNIISNILTVLIVLFLLGLSASGKFMKLDAKFEESMTTNHMEYGSKLRMIIGIIEVLCTIIWIFPRTMVIGTMLLTSYMGGAIATHLTHGDYNIIFQVVITAMIWITAFMRAPELTNRLLGKK